MSWADHTPEQRLAARAKAKATRERKKAEAAAAAAAGPVAEEPSTLADLGLAAEPEDDFRLDDILSNEEIEAIRKRAREEVAAEQRKSRARLLHELAKDEARRDFGLVPVDEARQKEIEELTQIRIVLPSLRSPTGREIPPDPIIIDQRVYVHGKTYTVSVGLAEYLDYLMSQARMHMAQVDGRSRTYYNEQMGTLMWNGQAPAGGSLHQRFT